MSIYLEPTAAIPLATHEHAKAEQVARRLVAELQSVVTALPKTAHTPTGMARVLDMNRTIAHRIMSALGEAQANPLRTLALVPGIEALRQFVQKAGEIRPALSPELIVAASAAVEAFGSLIQSLAGSHAKLIARIEVTSRRNQVSTILPGRRLETRKAMFETTAALSGRLIGVRTSISIVRPVPGNPEYIEYVHVSARTKRQARPDAIPLVLLSTLCHRNADSVPEPSTQYRSIDNAPFTAASGLPLLHEFVGWPTPGVTMRQHDDKLLYLIEPPAAVEESSDWISEPDLVTGHRVPMMSAHPLRQSPPIFGEVLSVSDAIEWMVMDVYLHHSLASCAVPSMGLYFGHRAVNCDLTDRWFDLLKGAPLMEVLGPGISASDTDAYPRHGELTRHVFDRLAGTGAGWNPEEFVGYRCNERYPLWGSDYVMSFDFRRSV